MKGMFLAGLLTVAVGSAFAASTTDELKLVSGATTVTITDGGTGDLSAASGSILYSNSNFAGWNITFASGASNSPGLVPFGIDIGSLTAACNSGTCSSLQIWYSDKNFTTPVVAGGFVNSFSSTQSGGSVTQYAWDDTTNTLFGNGSSIGSVGPFTVTNHGVVNGGGPAGPAAYSLTLEDVLNGGSGPISYSLDGSITATPEPASLLLLGGALMGLGGLSLRKRAAK